MVRTERGVVGWMLFCTVLTAVFIFTQVPHTLKAVASGGLALAGPVVVVIRVLAVLREAQRVETEDGGVREQGAVERMLFEVAFIVPMIFSLSLTSLLRAFDE
jgi:hypothetical protein